MAFTYRVTTKPNPVTELAKAIMGLAADKRVEVKGDSRREIQQLQINVLKRLPGRIATQMNGDNVLYIWLK